jgi:multidrug resistance protein, MATE family
MQWLSLTTELKAVLRLMIPLAATALIEASTGFINNIMIAHLGAETLAATAIVSLLFMTTMIIFWGIFGAVSTHIAHFYGAKNKEGISQVMFDGIRLALVLAAPVIVLLWNIAPVLGYFGQPAQTIHLAQVYLHSLAWAVAPDFLSMMLWQFFIGIGHPRVIFVASLIYVPINIGANYVLMFGKFGFPNLGLAGIGLGTAVAYTTVLLFIVFIASRKPYRHYFKSNFPWFKSGLMGDIVRVGAPVGLMWAVEVLFFLAVGLIVAGFGTAILAAHQIAVQALFFLFTVINGLAQAGTIRVGHLMGGQEIEKLEYTRIAAVLIAIFYMAVIGLSYWWYPEILINLHFDIADPDNLLLVTCAISILKVSAICQVAEGIRYSMFGILRGMKDTQFTFITAVISLWLVVIPLTVSWVYWREGTITDIWWLMTCGALSGYVFYEWRFRQQFTVLLQQLRYRSGRLADDNE